MIAEYDEKFFGGDNAVNVSWYTDPFTRQKLIYSEMKLKYRSENDPERPPRREHGDNYIIVGLIVGLVVGGVMGAIIGYHYLGFISAIFCTIGGVFIGGIIGTVTGNVIKKRRRKTESARGGSEDVY